MRSQLHHILEYFILGVEMIGAMIVLLGCVLALTRFVRHCFTPADPDQFTRTRLLLARYLALALEFHLAADILSTLIAPSWEEIAKLGAIAVIRTGLNYFLAKEMKEEIARLE